MEYNTLISELPRKETVIGYYSYECEKYAEKDFQILNL